MKKTEMDIKRALEWVYVDQKVETYIPKSGRKLKVSSAPLASFSSLVGDAAELGFLVRGGGMKHSAETSDDAEYIHAVVCALPEITARLVMEYAKLREEPWWAPEGYRRQVPMVRKGKVVQQYDRNRHPIGPKMETVGYDPAEVDCVRAEYSLWFDALKALEEYFFTQARPLQSLVLTRTDMMREPWEEKKMLANAKSI